MEHEAGNFNCEACRYGYPVACECGGLIHVSKGCVVIADCDKCDEPSVDIIETTSAVIESSGARPNDTAAANSFDDARERMEEARDRFSTRAYGVHGQR